jgi:hypothetical protein
VFLLGVLLAIGTTIYCAISGDWPSSKYVASGIAYGVSAWFLAAPLRKWLFGPHRTPALFQRPDNEKLYRD